MVTGTPILLLILLLILRPTAAPDYLQTGGAPYQTICRCSIWEAATPAQYGRSLCSLCSPEPPDPASRPSDSKHGHALRGRAQSKVCAAWTWPARAGLPVRARSCGESAGEITPAEQRRAYPRRYNGALRPMHVISGHGLALRAAVGVNHILAL